MLHFNGLEPIDFGGRECEAKADQELKMRLRAVKTNAPDANEKFDELLAQAFEDDYAKKFIKEKLSLDDKIVIAAYISGGETAVNRISRATDGAIEAMVARATESR